jgi:hypothetical protein
MPVTAVSHWNMNLAVGEQHCTDDSNPCNVDTMPLTAISHLVNHFKRHITMLVCIVCYMWQRKGHGITCTWCIAVGRSMVMPRTENNIDKVVADGTIVGLAGLLHSQPDTPC